VVTIGFVNIVWDRIISFTELVEVMWFHVVLGSRSRFTPMYFILVIIYVVTPSTIILNDELGICTIGDTPMVFISLVVHIVNIKFIQSISSILVYPILAYIELPIEFNYEYNVDEMLVSKFKPWLVFFAFPYHLWIVLNILYSIWGWSLLSWFAQLL
jgi:hypothetical protein